jgi:putative membrane-bound dehydrogenase-like protein
MLPLNANGRRVFSRAGQRWFRLAGLAAALGLAAVATAAEFDLPPGFEVSRYSSDELAHNITAMTLDARGRVVVAGPGYIKTLHDDDGNGVADRAVLFSRVPASGAHGLCVTGTALLASGDRSIMRLHDRDGDGAADGAPEILRSEQDDREHGTHAIKQGPDGWYYTMIGNGVAAGAYRGLAEDSPVREPKQGALLRFSPDFQRAEAVAHGFRNAYDFDFTAAGHILTVDSDGERVHHLPGYAPTRLFDVAAGGHHGWMVRPAARAWSRETYFVDTVGWAAGLGRGSPTGVATYRHTRFPARYRDGVFSACWSFGTVYFLPLRPNGSTFAADREVFLQARGNDGFAPSALAVSPEGDLLVAIGGRSTRGGVFRVRYAGAPAPVAATDELGAVLAAVQPLGAWSRAQWLPVAQRLGRSPFETAALAVERPAAERMRAIEILVEVFGGVSLATALQLARDAEPAVAARVAWALGRAPAAEPEARALLCGLTRNAAATVQRASWEALLELPASADTAMPDWARGAASADRRVRAATVELARRWRVRDFASDDIRVQLAHLRLAVPDYNDPRAVNAYFEAALGFYQRTTEPGIRLEAIQLMQIGLGDISVTGDCPEWCDIGYSGIYRERVDIALRRRISSALLAEFPGGMPESDAETARLIGMLQVGDAPALEALAAFWTAETSPSDDLHYLLVATQLPGIRPAEVRRRTARALALLHDKMDARQWLPSTFWPARVREIFQRIVRFDPAFAETLAADPAFGRAEHSLFVESMTGPARAAAARRLLAAAERSNRWSAELIALVAGSLPPDESKPALRRQQTDPALREAIAVALARDLAPADHGFLLESLASIQTAAVPKLAPALQSLPAASPAELGLVLRGLARHERDAPAQQALQTLLLRWTAGENAPSSGGFAAWSEWFSRRHPDEAAALRRERESDPSDVLSQLQGVAWGLGDAERGRTLYQERGCFACHEGAKLGPDLRGIATRFNREDLFLHIVKPNLAISPAYRAMQVTMRDGTVHVGEAVYDSPEAVLLEIAAGTTIRLTGTEILRTEPARRSPMPEGLLRGLKRSELADLYAHLRILK